MVIINLKIHFRTQVSSLFRLEELNKKLFSTLILPNHFRARVSPRTTCSSFQVVRDNLQGSPCTTCFS